jgi:hypothetical protein
MSATKIERASGSRALIEHVVYQRDAQLQEFAVGCQRHTRNDAFGNRNEFSTWTATCSIFPQARKCIGSV